MMHKLWIIKTEKMKCFWACNSWYFGSLAPVIFTKWQFAWLWIALDVDEFNSHTPAERNWVSFWSRRKKSKCSNFYHPEANINNSQFGRWAVQTIAPMLPCMLGYWKHSRTGFIKKTPAAIILPDLTARSTNNLGDNYVSWWHLAVSSQRVIFPKPKISW